MAKTEMQIRVDADTRLAMAWVKAMRVAAYLIGPNRALRAARWGAPRLVRFRIDNGRWRWLGKETVQ